MTNVEIHESKKPRTLLITIAAILGVVVIAVGAFFIWSASSSSEGTDQQGENSSSGATSGNESTDEGGDMSDPTQPGTVAGTGYLPSTMNGQEAIDALGDKIDAVAKQNGMSSDELEELLLRDNSAHITKRGFIVYFDNNANTD